MNSLAKLDQFEPTNLKRAREQIVAQHPVTATSLPALSGDAFARLRAKIEAAAGDKNALARIATELTAREVRSLVTGVVVWDDIRDAVALILYERRRASLLPGLWRAWQRIPEYRPLRDLVADLGNQFGWTHIVSPLYVDSVQDWVSAEDPAVEIQRWLDRQGLGYSDLLALAESPFVEDAPLLRLIRNAVLMYGSRAQLIGESVDNLRAWLDELPVAGERMRFGRNYLERLDPTEWDLGIASQIRRSYGMPKRGSSRFWDQVAEGVRTAFHRLFIGRQLSEALGRDSDRRAYWQRWTDEMVDIQFGTAGSTRYAIFDFGTFGVIEFFKVGHAAYFYPTTILERIVRGPVYDPRDLRMQLTVPFARLLGNRLIHQGDWYYKADRMVRLWLRMAGQDDQQWSNAN